MVHFPKEKPTGIAGGGGVRSCMKDALDGLGRLVAESMTDTPLYLDDIQGR